MLLCCLAILIGLVAARKLPYLNYWPAFTAAVITILSFKTNPRLFIAGLIILSFTIALYRGQQQFLKLNQLQSLAGHQVTIHGSVLADSVYGNKSQLAFTLGNLQLQPGGEHLLGNLAVSGFGEPMVYRGDNVEVSGKIYLSHGQPRLSFAQISRLAAGSNLLDSARRKFTAGMLTALPEPQASFAMGLLVGQRSTLPPDLLAALSVVGLTHIIAVSGYNLTILVNAVRRSRLFRSRYQTLAASLILIVLFIELTGLSASIVRAALVSGLVLACWYYGRAIRPLVLILFAAALTALWNPQYIWSDIGWYLSFLAFAGILILAPAVKTRYFGSREPGVVLGIALETFCATLMTAPLIMFVFGKFGLLSLAANVLVVPLIPLAMLCALIAGIAGWLLPAYSGWLALPAKWLIGGYILKAVTVLANAAPAVTVKISAAYMAALYSLLAAPVLILHRRGRPKVDNYPREE